LYINSNFNFKLAREIATISYRSGPEWELRFGRKRANENQSPALCPDFLIETYLDHQGERFCLQYDPNSLLYISKAMDMFDMSQSSVSTLQAQRQANLIKYENVLKSSESDAGTLAEVCRQATGEQSALEGREEDQIEEPKTKTKAPLTTLSSTDPATQDLVEGMKGINMPTLVLGVQSDILFPVWQQKEIAECLKASGNNRVTYYELDAMFGHDTFLIDRVSVGGAIKGHLELLD
jgi:homoserine O-acetyltransferase